MIRRPPRSTRVRSSAASDVYKRQVTVCLSQASVCTAERIKLICTLQSILLCCRNLRTNVESIGLGVRVGLYLLPRGTLFISPPTHVDRRKCCQQSTDDRRQFNHSELLPLYSAMGVTQCVARLPLSAACETYCLHVFFLAPSSVEALNIQTFEHK